MLSNSILYIALVTNGHAMMYEHRGGVPRQYARLKLSPRDLAVHFVVSFLIIVVYQVYI